MKNEEINRRKFLQSATASAGMAAFVPFVGINGIAELDKKKSFDKEAFIEGLTSADRYFLSAALIYPEEVTPKEIEDAKDRIEFTRYSVEKISPRGVAEFNLVAAASWKGKKFKGIIDEYIRRRSGLPPALPHHDIFRNNGFLDLYDMLPFWQQADAILAKLTGLHQFHEAPALTFKIRKGDLLPDASSSSKNDFAKLLTPEYRRQLSDDDLSTICERLHYYIPLSEDYMMAAIQVSGAFIEMNEIA